MTLIESTGVDHIDLYVSDLDRSAAFYDAVLSALGFRRVSDDDTIVWRSKHVEIGIRAAESSVGPEGYIEARDEVRGVMALLGSSMGPVVWDVCGNGISLRQHVDHVAGRSVPEAKGRLIAGLDLMARHWKLDDG